MTTHLPRRGLIAAAAVLASVATALPAAVAEDAIDTARLAGETRYETAAAIARAAFPDGAEIVYLARSDDVADALAAGVLTDGPVLLVPRCDAVPKSVADTVDALDPQRVVALGGTSAVCATTLAAAAAGRQSGRLAGDDRIRTSAAIARAAFPEGANVLYVAAADATADALAAGALTDGPVVLAPTRLPLPDELDAVVADLDPDRIVGVGGPVALPDEVLDAVAAGRITDRLAGVDRFATAVAIARHVFAGGAPTAYLARADDPVDAVAGGALTDGPVLLTSPCGAVPSATAAAIAELSPQRLTALGGDRAICPWTLDRAAGHAPPAEPTRPLTTDDVTLLAARLTMAEESIRAGEPDPAWLTSLARWQHAIYRRLTVAPHLQEPVLAALPAHLHTPAREQITAATELRSMVTRLRDEPPDTWRIVEPPPLDELVGYYAEAEAASGVAWQYLAAIHLVETRFGKIQGTSTAGAQGPMQFMPATWDAYGEGDVNDPRDAILAAARYLRAHGAPADMDRALYAYNHDTRYVRAVTRHATLMAQDPDLLHGYHRWEVWYLTTTGDVLLPVGWDGSA